MNKKVYSLFFLVSLIISCGGKNVISNSGLQSNISSKDTILFSSKMSDKVPAIYFVAQEWNLEPHFLLTESLPNKISDENLEKIRMNNISIWKKLDSIKKINTKKEFRKQLINETDRIYHAQQIIDSNKVVQEFLTKTYKTGKFVAPAVYSKSNDSEYIWRMWRDLPNKVKDKYENVKFADFKINLKRKTVEIIKFEK